MLKTEKQTLPSEYSGRIGRVRASLAKTKADGFLITDPHNLRYLSGFTGSSGFALITHRNTLFVTDFRYQDQAQEEVTDFDIDIEKGDRLKTIEALTRKFGIKKLGIESSVTYEFFKRLSDKKLSLIPQFYHS